MTATEQRNENRAAALFAGFLTLALGGAGLLIAAVAVGVERAWAGGTDERNRARERTGSWLDSQREWLAADHQRRVARSRAARAWVAAGSPADQRPSKPSRATRFGVALRRAVANAALGAVDFGRGMREGWTNAEQVRREGGQFQDIWQARRGPAAEVGQVVGSQADRTEPAASETGPTPPQGGPSAPGDATSLPEEAASVTPNESKPAVPPSPVALDRAMPDDTVVDDTPPSTAGTPAPATTAPNPNPNIIEGALVTETETAAVSQAESNAAVLRGLLAGINDKVGEVADVTDNLAAVRTQLQGQVQQADEFATATGQSTQAKQALDATNAVVAQMGKHLSDFTDGSVHAQDQLGQASDGLRVAEDADDQLRSAGADGRAVAPAGAHA